jgi:hypothetical protein
MEIIYPSADDVIGANKKAVELLRVTKAEKHKLVKTKKSIELMPGKYQICRGQR